MKIKPSKFASSIKVVFLSEGDEKYDTLKKFFEIHGYAFVADNHIFMDVTQLKNDGYFKKEYLQFIEAHEIAHIALGHHGNYRSKQQEAEADFVGIELCRDKGFTSASKIGIKNFKSRNKIDLNKFSEKHREKLLQSV